MTRLFLLLTLLLFTQPVHAKPVEWSLDQAHSRVGFTARHLGLAKVRGQFAEYNATILADDTTAQLISVKATAQADSIDTDNGKRDKHLRSDEFLAAAKHPTLALQADSFKFNGDDFVATAKVTIRGVTKKVKFKGTRLGVQVVDFGDGPRRRAAFEATGTINRKDFGLDFNAVAEGIAIVSDEVQINLELEIFTKM